MPLPSLTTKPVRLLLLLGGVLSITTPIHAQPSVTTEVEAVVQALFEGMRTRDTASVRALFHPDARMYTSHRVGEEPVLEAGSLDQFLQALGKPSDLQWDERIEGLQIHEDGTLAQAWMQYVFYLGETPHHAGVNAMTLVRSPKGWQILHLTDTRRKP